ncbi:MAG: hypothetical protein HOV80_13190 [Polyangiaceae bacterium]|nr:hypothetical protein [Polyangiaceae bacterium]
MSNAVYTVRAGEDLADIANHQDSTVDAIWHHPDNAEVVKRRRLPERLLPGDVVYVPWDPAAPAVAEPPALDPPSSITQPTVTEEGWPYELSPGAPARPAPSWTCPGGTCECHGNEGPEILARHTVFLYDSESRRMPNARCRVLLNGQPLEAPPNADGSGAISFEVGERARAVEIEWAPADTPLDPRLPYRRRYRLVLDGDSRAGVRERLEHIGVSRKGSLEDRIVAFQRAYGLEVDGSVESVEGPLTAYHDRASLPKLATAEQPVPAPIPPDIRPPHQGCVSGVERSASCHFSFRLLRGERQPCARASFTLDIGDGRVFRGMTDGDGRLEYGDVPAGDYALVVDNVRMHVPALPKSERGRPLLVCADR